MRRGLRRDGRTARLLRSRYCEGTHQPQLSERPPARSHVILEYTNPDTGEVRTVTVPKHDRLKIGTLQSIAEQCGAADFHKWCRWVDDLR
ncbi:type II toxin-antitoxin system HicA family toxin [Halobaculum magnesiiphilum]|uniref:type II toxin-antitoxin system HicA family toxin n=1 Tax=Halobaculum magnesiiphilum TaxID=1017351 RepID=UPI0031F2FAF0